MNDEDSQESNFKRMTDKGYVGEIVTRLWFSDKSKLNDYDKV